MIDDRNGVNAAPEKIDPENLPNLTRSRKLRARTESLIATAKKLLVSGIGPNEVACRLRLDPAVVLDLYQSWNPRYRKVTPPNAWTCQKLAIQCFGTGAPLNVMIKNKPNKFNVIFDCLSYSFMLKLYTR
ncbi:hypothetical protein [Raoultella sp. 10-1]|uniref:hypothetical protein n=1 Tax=Raoultella sp. 10-1 TaxID=2683201 RepID=UPI001178B2D6|nr:MULTISPECIES: hypothetical protein [Enterobacteriaceae]MVT03768.1 hypothetical protein [Raoultella sp. 10-1]